MQHMHSPFNILLILGFSLYLSGCTSTVLAPSLQDHSPAFTSEGSRQKATEGERAGQKATTIVYDQDRKGREDLAMARLVQLWSQRTQEVKSTDYSLGPGDVLEISVPGMGELESRTVRVAGDGTIDLPFTGVIEVQGSTESEVKEKLRQSLLKYKRNPQVSLFVREYRSRLVAVAGAVEKPGLYVVASSTETLLDVISQAGGMTKDALPQVILLPAGVGEGEKENRLASTSVLQLQTESAVAPPIATPKIDPIIIDLQRLHKGQEQLYLTLPVRPGDALIVPSGGEVIVGGWVDKPGSYKITPGLTVLGAVSAAGDTLFPADRKSVKVIRTDTTGEKSVMSADLQRIASGESPDIPVQEGDVIEVNPSTVKLVSYGMYNFFRVVFNFGAQMRPY